MSTKPQKIILGWKYRNEPPENWREANVMELDYENDADGVLAGTQNIGEIWNVPHDPSVEIMDVFAVSVSRSGKRRKPKLQEWAGTTLLKETGVIDASQKSFDVLKPTNSADFFVGAIFKIDNELFTINTITPGSPNDTWAVKRAQHGTAAASHALDATVRRMNFNVGHRGVALSGVADAGKANVAQFFILRSATDDLGNGIEFEFGRPTSNIQSLISYEIQLSTTLWAETVADVTGVRGILHQGTDGAIIAGQKTLTTSDTLNVDWAGKMLYTYEDITLSTGEIGHPRAFTIDTIVDNGEGIWTITVLGDESFSLSSDTEGTVNFIVCDGFQRAPNELVAWIQGPPVASKFIPPSTPARQSYTVVHKTSETVYARMRWITFFGTSPWIYHDGGTGTATRLSATTFTPTGMQGGGIGNNQIGAVHLTENAMNFNTDIVFSATDNDTVQWTAGTIEFADGSIFSIAAGNTGAMTAKTWIYLDPDVSTTVLQVTSSRTTAVGDRIQIMAVAINVASASQDAFFFQIHGTMSLNEDQLSDDSISTIKVQTDAITTTKITDNAITTPKLVASSVTAAKLKALAVTADKIAANAITSTKIRAGAVIAGKIAANAVTAVEINVATLSSITADIGTLTAGTISGVLYRTASSGIRIEMTSSFTNQLRYFNSRNRLIGSLRSVGNNIQLLMESGMGNIVLNTQASSAIINLVAGSSVTAMQLRGTEVDCLLNLDMNTRNIINVGNIELDSITKDGAGDITVKDNLVPRGSRNLGARNSRWNAIFAVSVNFSGGATIGDSGGDQFALNARLITDVLPSIDNSYDLGSSSRRWADLKSVRINGADIGLENGWKFREWPCTKEDVQKRKPKWFKKHANLGIQVLDDQEKLIAVIHKDGYIYCKGIKPLEDLQLGRRLT